MLIGLSLFLYQLLQTNHCGFKTGLVFGLGWFGAGISWVHVSIADFGGIPLAGSLSLMALLCGYLALYPAIFGFILHRFIAKPMWLLVAPPVWFILENIRSWMLTGFPWLSVGYSQLNSPLGGWMPVIGETGLSAIMILLCLSLALGLKQRKAYAPIFISITLMLGGWTLNQINWVSVNPQNVSIAMVQGNIKQELRWMPEQEVPTMRKYLRMTAPIWQNNDLVIWPEAAVPQLESGAEFYLQELDEKAQQTNTGLITGIVNYNFDTRQAFNNLIVVGKNQANDTQGHYHYLHENRYDKHHLLPIGEFIPFENWLRQLAPIFDLPMSSFTRGEYQQPNLVANGYHLAPAICFEIAFPRQLAANLTDNTDFIVTVSNDAWFGTSHGPAQHLEIAQVRAKEFGIPVLRATNTGITAFIDHTGKIVAQLPQFEAAVLSAQIHTTEGQTPYAMFGDYPFWMLTLLLLLIFIRNRSRN